MCCYKVFATLREPLINNFLFPQRHGFKFSASCILCIYLPPPLPLSPHSPPSLLSHNKTIIIRFIYTCLLWLHQFKYVLMLFPIITWHIPYNDFYIQFLVPWLCVRVYFSKLEWWNSIKISYTRYITIQFFSTSWLRIYHLVMAFELLFWHCGVLKLSSCGNNIKCLVPEAIHVLLYSY